MYYPNYEKFTLFNQVNSVTTDKTIMTEATNFNFPAFEITVDENDKLSFQIIKE